VKFSASVFSKNGLKKFVDIRKNLDELDRQTNALIALEIRNGAIKLLNENKDGPRRQRYNPKRIVNAAPPGSPPNTDTGRLVQSIEVEKGEGNSFLVGTNLKYGAWLEFGTRQMDARPWLSVAVKLTSKKLKEISRTAYQNLIKRLIS
jgi:HK97 gp10 family phage protein